MYTFFNRNRPAARVLLVMLFLQLLLFRQFCQREIVPVFPRAFDQTAYLGMSYDLFESIRSEGLIAGLSRVAQFTAPQGILLEVEGALAQFLDGPGRLSALEVNLAHLAVFEIALLAIACWIGRPLWGLALGGLLLSAGTIYLHSGGIADFRLDFAAFCLFGVLICTAIRSAFFRLTGWTLAFALVAGALILTRSIYVAHLAPALGLLFLALLIGYRIRPDVARPRLVNLTMGGLLLILIALPSLVSRWAAIRAYYIRGHTSSEAPLRAREQGVASLLDSLTFYLRSVILVDHAGTIFLIIVGLLLLAVLIPSRSARRRPEDVGSSQLRRSDLVIGLAWLATMTATIYVVLTADVSKSPVVGNVFIAIIVTSLLLLPDVVGVHLRAGWRVAVCVAAFVIGQGVFASHAVQRLDIAPEGADMREYGRIMDTIARLSRDYGLARPVVSFDAVSEFTHIGVVKTMAYERLQLPLSPVVGLARIDVGLLAITPAEADEALTRSDFALLGNDRDPHQPEPFPINQSLVGLAPHLYERATREMVRLDEGTFFGRRLTLFMKATMACAGESGGWMTSAGLECHAPGAIMAGRPVLRLAGEGNFEWLGGTPVVTAQVGQENRRAPASVSCPIQVDATGDPNSRPYAITCNLGDLSLDPAQPVQLHLQFDRDFVPKDRGLNDDTRHLVLRWPRAINALPASSGAPAPVSKRPAESR